MDLNLAIKAIKSGDREAGRDILINILETDERNEAAWLWLTQTTDDKAEQIEILEEVLRINPDNSQAKRGLERLKPKKDNTLRRLRDKKATAPPKPKIRNLTPKVEEAVEAQPPSKAKSNLWPVIILLIILSPLALCGLCLAAGSLNPESDQASASTATPSDPTPTPTPDIGGKASAHYQCQDFVSKRLKAPSTAEFSGLFSSKAAFIDLEEAGGYGVITSTLHGPGVWVTAGEVDAQNSFGAMLRHRYTCILDYDNSDKTWYLVDISLKEQ